jgi:hypothetical protein
MALDRRRLLAFGAATALAGSTSTHGRHGANVGVDAAQFGLRPGSPDDQSRSFQRVL